MSENLEKRVSDIEKEMILVVERLRIVQLLVFGFVGLALTAIATALIASVVKGQS